MAKIKKNVAFCKKGAFIEGRVYKTFSIAEKYNKIFDEKVTQIEHYINTLLRNEFRSSEISQDNHEKMETLFIFMKDELLKKVSEGIYSLDAYQVRDNTKMSFEFTEKDMSYRRDPISYSPTTSNAITLFNMGEPAFFIVKDKGHYVNFDYFVVDDECIEKTINTFMFHYKEYVIPENNQGLW